MGLGPENHQGTRIVDFVAEILNGNIPDNGAKRLGSFLAVRVGTVYAAGSWQLRAFAFTVGAVQQLGDER